MLKFDDAAVKQIAATIREIESRSSAELVVEIRGRSGSYAHADHRLAALLAIVSLIVLVFMPFEVPPIAVILDPIAVYLAGLMFSRRSDPLRRLFTKSAERAQAVRTQAAALFHDRGIANTASETGILFYASLLERRIEVLADRGLLRRLVPHEWNAQLADLRDAHSLDPESVIAALQRLGAMLARDVPVGEGDVDELSSVPEIKLK